MIKVASHIHSDWSYDGKWSLPSLAREFEARGYRALLITDHDKGFTERKHLEHRVACEAASTERLLVVPGIEYSDADNRVHVLVWGRIPFLGEGLATSVLLDRVRAADGIAVLAHPTRRQAWQVFDPAWQSRLLGIEIWNRKTDGWAPSEDARRLLSVTRVASFVGMDFHDWKQMFPLSMELETGPDVSEDAVLTCLRSGAFRPTLAGRPVDRFVGGRLAGTLHAAERLRKTAAYVYHGVSRRTGHRAAFMRAWFR